jgi:hypothetical protein
LAVRVVQVAETQYDLSAIDPSESEFVDDEFEKWATAIFIDAADDEARELLDTTRTVSDARSAGFDYLRSHPEGDHECLPEPCVERLGLAHVPGDDANNNGDGEEIRTVTEDLEWVGTDQCPSCSASGQFTVASRPEVIAMYGPETAREYFTSDDATHVCLECGFLWFGVADHVEEQGLWRVRMAADGKRIERVPNKIGETDADHAGESDGVSS